MAEDAGTTAGQRRRRSRSRTAAEAGRLDALLLSAHQRRQLEDWQHQLQQAPAWSGELPVALLEPAWRRLQGVPVARLALVLPPELAAEAPELVRYRQLTAAGWPAWEAEQQCWLDFGSEACQRALRQLWQRLERPERGWSLADYLGLLQTYRHQLESGQQRRLPLVVVAASGGEPHQLLWLHGSSRPMRHTCA